jgi:hypothetical protein
MTMRKLMGLAPLLFLLAGLAGCASIEPYGNFLGANAPATLNEKLAADTVKQLTVLYPPASTRFDLGQSTPDAYGSALVESLRIKGYAILEFEPDEAASADSAATAGPGLSLRYVLDAPASTNLYRVTLMVGSQSLSRAYVAQNDSVAPAGAWVRKE